MATCEMCKDCIHYDVCEYDGTLAHINCGLFKDSRKFVELPCKLFDTIYSIKGGEVTGHIVKRFNIERLDIKLIGAVVGFFRCYDIGYAGEFGTRLFLTKEEAEQALAKQNQPDNTPQ